MPMVHVAVGRVGQAGSLWFELSEWPLDPKAFNAFIGLRGSVSSRLTKCYRGFNTSDSEPTNLDDA